MEYLHDPDPKEEGTTERVLLNNRTQKLVYRDAVQHGLFEDMEGLRPRELCQRMIWRAEDEMKELQRAVDEMPLDAAEPSPQVADEAADVQLVLMSYCEKLGIMLGTAVEGKRQYNRTRTYKHLEKR